METLIKTASIRIALAYQYSTFEVAINLENENGIPLEDIHNARVDCQKLATDAVNDYKGQPNQNPKIEIQRIENKLKEIKKLVTEREPEAEKEVDPKEIEKVAAMPLYQPKGNKVDKVKTPPHSKIPNDIMGLGADD